MHEAYAIIHVTPWVVGVLAAICFFCYAAGKIVAAISWRMALVDELPDAIFESQNEIQRLQDRVTALNARMYGLEQQLQERSDAPSYNVSEPTERAIAELDAWLGQPVEEEIPLTEQDLFDVSDIPPASESKESELIPLDSGREEADFDIDVVEPEPEKEPEEPQPKLEEVQPEQVSGTITPAETKSKQRKRRRRKRARRKKNAKNSNDSRASSRDGSVSGGERAGV